MSTETASGGRKDDGKKVRMDLLPPGAMLEIGNSWRVPGFVQRARTSLEVWRWAPSKEELTESLRQIFAAFDALDREPSYEIARVLTFGAVKYAPGNWKRVIQAPDGKTRYYAAALRHLAHVRHGNERDLESGLLHLAHAGCCLIFLLSEEVGFDE